MTSPERILKPVLSWTTSPKVTGVRPADIIPRSHDAPLPPAAASRGKGEKAYGCSPSEMNESQMRMLRSSIARLVSLTPWEDGLAEREERWYFFATGWPKAPPPWTTTALTPEAEMALAMEATASARYEKSLLLSLTSDPPSLTTTLRSSTLSPPRREPR